MTAKGFSAVDSSHEHASLQQTSPRQADYVRLWAGHRRISGRLEALQQRIGHVFNAPEHLYEALTHRSALMEWNAGTDEVSEIACNERLEFLGDSVLSLAVTRRLMEWEGDLSEGELSKIRASLVNEEALATVARAIDLGDALLLGRGAHRSGGRELDSLLADAIEAVIGAVFVDAGYEAADQLVGRVFWKSFTGDLRAVVQTDYKTALQELMQDRIRQTPTYEVTTSSGPDHEKQFEVKVLVGASELGRGTGPSKKRASQAAAHAALLSLADSDDANEQEAES